MNQEIIRNYARLIARVGANVQPGQEVFVHAGLETADFVHLLVEECYLAGARKVFVDYADSALDRLDITHGDEETFAHLNEMEVARQKHFLKNHPCRIFVESDDPDALKGIDQAKYGRIVAARSKEIWTYRKDWDSECQWTIAGYPSRRWAKKVYPELSEEEAYDALRKAILMVSRADKGDPIQNWKEHNERLTAHKDRLNALRLRKLHYRSRRGTDLTVGLVKDVLWEAGGERTRTSRVFFQPNIPTEECFTSPDKDTAEGIVYATKPLSLRGEVVEDFSLRFHEGRIVEVHARKGEEVLRDAIETNENGCYLGECALVPVDSPINRTGILFYSTLFDENASCHLAFGRAFTNLIKDYEKKTAEEIKAIPLNESTTHVDFMIGDETLDIDGEDEDGRTIPIFRNGLFAF